MKVWNISEQQGGQGQPSPLYFWGMTEVFDELDRSSKKEISRKENYILKN